jgi:hypothetical protein
MGDLQAAADQKQSSPLTGPYKGFQDCHIKLDVIFYREQKKMHFGLRVLGRIICCFEEINGCFHLTFNEATFTVFKVRGRAVFLSKLEYFRT